MLFPRLLLAQQMSWQWILLPVIGIIFVIEAFSVIVAGLKSGDQLSVVGFRTEARR